MFQALEIEDEKFVNDLLVSLAKHLGFPKIPRIDQNSMRQELLAAASSTKQQTGTNPEKASALIDKDIPLEVVEILKVLVHVSDRGPTVRDLAGQFNMTEQRMQYFLDLLDDKNLIYRALYMGSPSTYSLSSEGRKYLFGRGLL
jgi:hypothetical protein